MGPAAWSPLPAVLPAFPHPPPTREGPGAQGPGAQGWGSLLPLARCARSSFDVTLAGSKWTQEEMVAPWLKVQPEVGVALGAGRPVSRPGLAAPPGLQALNPRQGWVPEKRWPSPAPHRPHLGSAQGLLLPQSGLCPQAWSRGGVTRRLFCFFFNLKFFVCTLCGRLAPH